MRKFKAAFGTVISMGGVIGLLILFDVCVGLTDRRLGAPSILPAVTAIFLGAAAAAIGIFWAAWAYGYLVFIGRGAPAELFGAALLPTRQLVTCGPYAYTRNPMVFGVLWLALGIVLYRRSLVGIVLIPLVTVAVIVYLRLFEEPALERRFGEPYHRYRLRVPMLIPRFHAIVTGEPEDSCEATTD